MYSKFKIHGSFPRCINYTFWIPICFEGDEGIGILGLAPQKSTPDFMNMRHC
jgi:hypothetical protein